MILFAQVALKLTNAKKLKKLRLCLLSLQLAESRIVIGAFCFFIGPLLLPLHMKWWWACWLLWHWLCTFVVWATLQVMFLGKGLGLLRRLGRLQAQSGLWLGLGPCAPHCALHHNTSLEPPVKSTKDLA